MKNSTADKAKTKLQQMSLCVDTKIKQINSREINDFEGADESILDKAKPVQTAFLYNAI